MRGYYLLLFLCLALISMGCAGKGDPATPSPGPSTEFSARPAHAGATNHSLLGFWTISIPADRSNVAIIPDRVASMHLNALGFLDRGPCDNCLTFYSMRLISPNELIVEIELQHPYPDSPRLMVFDVRGILISGADYTFPASGR